VRNATAAQPACCASLTRAPVGADIFLDAVKQVVAANKAYIPPEGKVCVGSPPQGVRLPG
jgi:hypothetical protein